MCEYVSVSVSIHVTVNIYECLFAYICVCVLTHSCTYICGCLKCLYVDKHGEIGEGGIDMHVKK